ncbi:MAG TPA: diguanylate cyclase [Verrucomicrobiae bacterium]|nr:diguanylate cyclase [Verrucomicrobiae bacterium]
MRILVSDTDPSVLALVSTRLTARGYDVVEIEKKEMILPYLEQESADLILLSTEMDRLGSSCLIEKIRERPHLAKIPVIMMTDQDHLAELVVGQERGFDDFLIKPFDAFVLQLRVAINIRRTRERIDANALTHLPGNHAIDRIVTRKLETGEKFSVLYVDINNFKTFNDRYGFEKGDDVLRQTAKLLIEQAKKTILSGDYFIGHVGGDDFVVVLRPEFEAVYARGFLAEFDRVLVTYYNEEDQKRGHIRVTNRRGKRETFPLMSCSVAACNNLHRTYKSLGEIAQDAAQVKAFLKSQPGSHYLRDRRCEPIRQLEKAYEILSQETDAPKAAKETEELLGQALLSQGFITEEQLTQALKKHFQTGRRLGQILISMKAVKSEELGGVLEKKWGVPYVNLKQSAPSREALGMFSVDYMQSRKLVPLAKSETRLKVAMANPSDVAALADVERITGLKPDPCLVLENELEHFWANLSLEGLQEERVG